METILTNDLCFDYDNSISMLQNSDKHFTENVKEINTNSDNSDIIDWLNQIKNNSEIIKNETTSNELISKIEKNESVLNEIFCI